MFILSVFVGTSPFGVDVRDYKRVGLRNHFTLSSLSLKPGITYYVSVKGKYGVYLFSKKYFLFFFFFNIFGLRNDN